MITESPPLHYSQKASITPKLFQFQIRYLKNKYAIISLDEAYDKVMNNKKFDNNLVITFDDGFREVYDNAFPILKDEGLSATVLLISNCLNNSELMWRNKLIYIENTVDSEIINKFSVSISEKYLIRPKSKNQTLLDWSDKYWSMTQHEIISDLIWKSLIDDYSEYMKNKKPYLSILEIEELIENDWLIGNHSKTHPIFNKLDYETFESEILECKSKLESSFGIQVQHFTYPFGIRAKKELENRFIKIMTIKSFHLLVRATTSIIIIIHMNGNAIG